MSLSRLISRICLLGIVLVLAGSAARADGIWTITIDTSSLAADTGPFGLDFELVGTNGNTVSLSNFSYGSGGSAGPGGAFITGGATGDLASGVTLSDSSSFFTDFNQQFTPGDTLTFTIDSTLIAPAGGGIDNFSMVIFQGYDPVNGYDPIGATGGITIPSTDPSGNNLFVNLDIVGPGSAPVTFQAASVPEPSSAAIMLFGVLGISGAMCWRRGRIGRRRLAS
jgi:hypothetical protein